MLHKLILATSCILSLDFFAVAATPSFNNNVAIDLLDANHILHFLDIVDAFGHISVRNPDNASQFVMSFAIAPAAATSQSLVTYDILNATALQLTFNDSVRGTDIPSSFIERYIHSQIYASHPDVSSVVHSHTLEVLPFAAIGVGLQAHIGAAGSIGVLSNGTPIFDFGAVVPDDSNQPHDLLIRNEDLGDALAGTFEDGSDLVLMKGHGMAIRGTSIRQATFRAYNAKRSAMVQAQAMLLNGGRMAQTGLTAKQAMDAGATNEAEALLGRAWDLWVQQIDQDPLYHNDLRV